jgi:hypothetical protein
MSTQPSSSSFGLGSILVLAGACVAALGAVLPWAKLSLGTTTSTASGVHGWEGKTILILCAGMVVRGVVSAKGGRRIGPMIVIGGLAIAGIAGYTLATMHSQIVSDGVSELQKSFPTTTPDAIRALLEQMLAIGTLTISAQPGIYLCIAGGVAGAAGGVMTAMRTQAVAPATVGSPQPVGADGSNGAQAGPWIGGPVQAPLATADTADAWATQHANAAAPPTPQAPQGSP